MIKESASSSETFHFAFASDEKFVIQLQVAVLSLIKASVGTCACQCIHVLDCGISDETWRKICDRVDSYACKNNVIYELCRHHIDMTLFEKFREWNTSKAAYARLLLPELIPDNRYCVYSDCDVLFFNNPWDMVLQLKRANVAILGHRNSIDGGLTNPDEKWFEEKGEPYNKSAYFCSGLIAMDLDKLRTPGALDSMFEFLSKYPDVVTADQTALNWYFRNDSALDDGGWGVFPNECFGDTCAINAIHYSGGTPWKTCDSWYKYLVYKKVDDMWVGFAMKMLGDEFIQRRILVRSRILGCIAFVITFVLLKLHVPFPWKREYLRLFSDMLYRHSFFDQAKAKLLTKF